MSRERSVIEKVGDWKTAYDAIRDELTGHQMRTMITTMTRVTPEDMGAANNPDDPKGIGNIQAYAALVQSSMHLARVVAANDRTAGVVAAMLTQSGVSRPTISVEEESI